MLGNIIYTFMIFHRQLPPAAGVRSYRVFAERVSLHDDQQETGYDLDMDKKCGVRTDLLRVQ